MAGGGSCTWQERGWLRPLGSKNHKMCFFFFTKHISWGVCVRVAFSDNHHHPSAVPLAPQALYPAALSPAASRLAGMVEASGWHSGQPEAGGSVTEQEGQHPPGSHHTPFDNRHTNHVGFDVCRWNNKRVSDNYIRTSPAVSLFMSWKSISFLSNLPSHFPASLAVISTQHRITASENNYNDRSCFAV